MGEKFPSKKFMKVIAEFLGRGESIIKPSTDIQDQFNIAGEPELKVGETRFVKIPREAAPPEPAWYGEFIKEVKLEPPEIPTIPIPEPPPIPQPNYVDECAERVLEALKKQQIYEMTKLKPYQDMVDDYKRRIDMAEIQLKSNTPVWSPSYDEVLQENKTLKAKCEALEEREQVIIDSIIECFGKRPPIIDDVIHLSGDSYNEMVRKINKVRTTE